MLRRLTTTTAPLFFKPSTASVARTAVVSRTYASSSDDFSSEKSDDSSSLGNFGSSQPRRGLQSDASKRDELAPQTIHFSGLPMTTTREKFTEAIQQAGFTGIQSVGVPTNSYDQRSKGYAFVTFDSIEAANKAKSQPFTYEGANITLSTTRTAEEQQNLKVYIGDLSYNTTESDLKTALEQFGPVDYVSIASVGTQSKGFGFASFKEISGAQAARSAGKFMLDDRPVRVEIARPRERRANPRYDSKEEDRFGSRGGYGRNSEDSYGSRGGDRSYGSSRGGDRYGGESSRGGDRSYGSSRGGDRSYGGSRGGDDGGYGGSRGGDRSYGSSRGGRGGEDY